MNEGGGPEDNRNASAVIDFVATTPGATGQTLDVGIDLGEDVLERLWTEGYQIDCVGNLSGCR